MESLHASHTRYAPLGLTLHLLSHSTLPQTYNCDKILLPIVVNGILCTTVFKVDFEKVYDSMSLDFFYLYVRFVFNYKWKSWIVHCVFVGNLAVLVSGFPT